MKRLLSVVITLTTLVAHALKPAYKGEEKAVILEGTVFTPSGEEGPYAYTQLVSRNGLIKMLWVFAASAVSEMGINFQYSPEYSPLITDIEEAEGDKVVPFVGYLDEEGNLQIGGSPAIYSTSASYSSSTGKIEFKDGQTHYLLYCRYKNLQKPDIIYKAYEILGIEFSEPPYPQLQAVGKYVRLTNDACSGPWLLRYRQVYGEVDEEPVGTLAVNLSLAEILTNSAVLTYDISWINGIAPEGEIEYSLDVIGDNSFEPFTAAVVGLSGKVEVENLNYFQPYNFSVTAMAEASGERYESAATSVRITTAVADGIDMTCESETPSELSANIKYSVEGGNVSEGVPMAILIAGNNGYKARKIEIGNNEGTVLVDGLNADTDYVFHIQPCAELGNGYVATGPARTVSFATLKDMETGVQGLDNEDTNVKYFDLNGIEISNPGKGEIVIERKGSRFRIIVK